MSLVKVQGNASGTGTLTIAAPNTNSNFTLDIPTASGTLQVSGNPISGTTGTFSGTISGGSTIGVGGATPSNSGAGITFPATQSASTDANTLDDYEEGTFTPSFANEASSTYSVKKGFYVKVGKQVTAWITIALSNQSGTSGGGQITGLPFTAENSTDYYGNVSSIYGNNWVTTRANLTGLISANTTTLTVYYNSGNSGGTGVVQISDYGNTGNFLCCVTYRATT